MGSPLLKVDHLSIKLKIDGHIYPVVEDFSFELNQGKTLALVGESGCGKSMTALALMGILPTPPALPPEGEVLYKGINLIGLKEDALRQIRGRHIAMIFQDPMSSLNPVFTIGDQLLEVAYSHLRLESEEAKGFVIKALEEVQLANPRDLITLYPHQLSGGMLQRVMIAMALICSPDILIADEPTTALDVTIQAQILQLLRELQEKKGMAILLITHDMGVVAQNADEVVVMYAGDQVEKGSVFSLFDFPSHPYTQALFASRPELGSRKKKLRTILGFVPRITGLPPGCPFHPRCPFAMELCKGGKVPAFPMKEKGHVAKCWLYDKELEAKLTHEEIT